MPLHRRAEDPADPVGLAVELGELEVVEDDDQVRGADAAIAQGFLRRLAHASAASGGDVSCAARNGVVVKPG